MFMRKKTLNGKKTKLQSKLSVKVRFSEVDSLRVVWHGHYVKYFEDGREDFGRKYGLGYMDVYEQGFATPIVKLTCDYKKPLKYEDEALIVTHFIDSDAAKILFYYEVFNKATEELVATGESVQVFWNRQNEMMLNLPDFFENWKRKWALL